MVIRPIYVAITLALSMPALSEPLGIPKMNIDALDPAVLEQVNSLSAEARRAASSVSKTDTRWIEELSARTQAQQEQTNTPSVDDPDKKHPLGEGVRTLIFVSWSMGANAIKDIMLAYDERPGTGVVFRGIPEGMKMVEAVSKMHLLTQETQSQVSVLLDPMAFRRHHIDTVPAIVLEADDDSLIVKAGGTSSIRVVDQAVSEGKPAGTDLGLQGPTSEIIEPDLMDMAKARIEALDTEAMKKRAIERFWHNQPGTPLPPVIEPATRMVDPSVIVQQDILDRDGNVVQKAGRINPLEMMPFNQKLVVIDPTQKWQVDLAKREYSEHGRAMTVTVMATQIPPSSGWELFEATQEEMDAPLYLLKPDMAERFQILRAPSVVTAEGLEFKVREYTRAEVEGVEDEI